MVIAYVFHTTEVRAKVCKKIVFYVLSVRYDYFISQTKVLNVNQQLYSSDANCFYLLGNCIIFLVIKSDFCLDKDLCVMEKHTKKIENMIINYDLL